MPKKAKPKEKIVAENKKVDATKVKPSKTMKRILIVEDERPLSHALELKLGNSGYETKVVETGTEAIEIIKENKFDLILLDLIIPEMDGFAVLKEFSKKKLKMPIIVLSNLGQEEDKERAKGMGVKEYCVKANTPLADIVNIVKSYAK